MAIVWTDLGMESVDEYNEIPPELMGRFNRILNHWQRAALKCAEENKPLPLDEMTDYMAGFPQKGCYLSFHISAIIHLT